MNARESSLRLFILTVHELLPGISDFVMSKEHRSPEYTRASFWLFG
jgi:hypothetical protein